MPQCPNCFTTLDEIECASCSARRTVLYCWQCQHRDWIRVMENAPHFCSIPCRRKHQLAMSALHERSE